MIIQSLREHFPARATEWVNAATLAAWGAMVLANPEMFNLPVFAAFHEFSFFLPAYLCWGMFTVIVGTVRLAALFVNGAYTRTPIIRLACSLLSAFVWSQVVIGFWLNPVASTALVMYSSMVVMDLISAYRASKDVAIAEVNRRSEKMGVRTGVSSSRSAEPDLAGPSSDSRQRGRPNRISCGDLGRDHERDQRTKGRDRTTRDSASDRAGSDYPRERHAAGMVRG
jgi:hypothetical protein